MRRLSAAFPFALLLAFSRNRRIAVDATVAISEIAYRGSGVDTCNGEDWIELINENNDGGATDADLTGYVLHNNNDDDADVNDEGGSTTDHHPGDATFPEGTTLKAGGYLVLCGGDRDFGFGIGNNDTITLLDPTGAIVDSVSLSSSAASTEDSAGGGAAAVTYAYFVGEFLHTTITTPGEDNVFYPPLPPSTEPPSSAGKEPPVDDNNSPSGDEISTTDIADIDNAPEQTTTDTTEIDMHADPPSSSPSGSIQLGRILGLVAVVGIPWSWLA